MTNRRGHAKTTIFAAVLLLSAGLIAAGQADVPFETEPDADPPRDDHRRIQVETAILAASR